MSGVDIKSPYSLRPPLFPSPSWSLGARDWTALHSVCVSALVLLLMLPTTGHLRLVRPSLFSLPPLWLYVNPIETEPVGEVGAGGSRLGGAHETWEQPRWDRCAVGAVHSTVVLNSSSLLSVSPSLADSAAHWWYFRTGLTTSHLAAYNCKLLPRTSLCPPSYRKSQQPWIWTEHQITINTSLLRSVASQRSPLITLGLSSWNRVRLRTKVK